MRGAGVLTHGDCSSAHNRVIYLGGHFGELFLAQDCVKHIVAACLQIKFRTAILIARDFALVNGSSIAGDLPFIQYITVCNRTHLEYYMAACDKAVSFITVITSAGVSAIFKQNITIEGRVYIGAA